MLRGTLPFVAAVLAPGAVVVLATATYVQTPGPPLPPPVVDRGPSPADLVVAPTDGTSPGGCQIVVVVDDRDADLALYKVGVDRTVDVWRARPNGKGAHRFSDLPPGTYHANAIAPGKAIAAAPTFTCGGKGERAQLVLQLAPPSATVAGRVVGHGKRAVGGAEVLLAQPEGRQGATAGVVHAPLAGDGAYAVPLAAGHWEILATAPHHTAQKQSLRVDGADVKASFALKASPVVQGVVVDDAGAPVPGAVVSLGGAFDPKVGFTAVVADDRGRYALPIPLDAPLVVVARGAGKVGRVALPPVREPAGVAGVSVAVAPGRVVAGEVMTQRGDAHPHAPVRVRVRALGLVDVVKTDAHGRFVVDGLPSGEDVELWADGSAIGAWGGTVAVPGQDRVLLTYVPPAY